jgi:hypothetical protein
MDVTDNALGYAAVIALTGAFIFMGIVNIWLPISILATLGSLFAFGWVLADWEESRRRP